MAKSPKKAPQPAASAKCDAVTFSYSTNKPSDGGNAGAACTVPWDCRSQACVSGQVGGQTVSFCASEVDCRENDDQLSDICPTGWKCAAVPDVRSPNATIRHTCVPPTANPCAPTQLVY